MYQRKNTPSMSTLQYCQHTREYLKGARSGKGTTGSVLGTSPFLTKASTGAGTRKTGAAANHKGRRHPRPTPSAQHQERPNKHKTKTQTHRRTTKQKDKHPDNQESFLLAELPLFSPPFRRCCDRFLGRRPRHAALGLRPTERRSQTN